MRILYVHQNFPAQFGHIARRLVNQKQWECFFVSQSAAGNYHGVEKIQYKLSSGATRHTHFCSRTFENTVWHCDAVFEALKARPDIKPDLIVGHSGFGSTLFLRELYPRTPVVNLFEYFYRPHAVDGDMDFRKDLGWTLETHKYLRSRCRNAMIMLDLDNCQLGYCPTEFQQTRFPREFQYKLRTVFDGIDRRIFHGRKEELRPLPSARTARTIAGVRVEPHQRIVTYVSRGLESMRGFDIFMRSAKLIGERQPDTVFIVVGGDRMAYGGDEAYVGEHKSFKDWVLSRDTYDLSKFHFVGWLAPEELATLLASTDLHMYLTVPFVLSWSMLNAMSCGAVVLGSNTAPVREMIQPGVNGLLADFFSPEEFADKAVKVLTDLETYRPLGRAAEEMIERRFSLDVTLPQMLKLYEDAGSGARSAPAGPPPGVAPAAAAPPPAAAKLVSERNILTTVKTPKNSPFRG